MNIFQVLIRSWQFLIQCVKFLNHNKDLLFFPIISIICTLSLAFILFAGGILKFDAISHFFDNHLWAGILGFIILYFFFSFVIVYFNASLIACTTQRLQGKEASIGDGLGLAGQHWLSLLKWTMLNTSIGLVIRNLENSHNLIEEIIGMILGISWTISTYFVIPVMVLQNVGPFKAIKTGFSIFGRGWRRVLSIFLIFHLFTAALIGILFGLAYLIPQDTKLIIEIAAFLVLTSTLIAATIGNAFNGIVNSALYLSYVEKSKPEGFDEALLQGAFAQKRRNKAV
jgi:hypothetical protein